MLNKNIQRNNDEIKGRGELSMQKLETIEEFEEVVKQYPEFLFFKHSITCPISMGAYREYEKFMADYPEIVSFFLHVQEARALSNYIAEKYAVKHESPQALVFTAGNVKWHTSHRNITYDALKKVLIGK